MQLHDDWEGRESLDEKKGIYWMKREMKKSENKKNDNQVTQQECNVCAFSVVMASIGNECYETKNWGEQVISNWGPS